MGRGEQERGLAGLLTSIGAALTRLGELREGASNVERMLDEYQGALDDVRMRNGIERLGAEAADDLSEEDWEIWDCCQGRIDATVEACRHLGYEVGRSVDGSWRVEFDCRR